ncbi:MAG: ArsC/Spx/MgsR family protein [Chitinophagaceae bacterium]
MMRKIYYLSTCDTCKKILEKINPAVHGFELQDIKKEKITASQLDQMKKLAGSFNALFSKRAILYSTMKLKVKILSEKEIRDLILKEYTFLKRPVIMYDEQIFIGNAPKEISKLLDLIS